MVIVITGIIAGMIALFIRAPVQGYFDAARRAELTDIADTAARRMARDIRTALPNSVRTTGTTFLEFYPTIAGGRYRREQNCTGACIGDVLGFSAPDNRFDVLGGITPAPAAGNRIVIYNNGTAAADAYALNNTGVVAAFAASAITLNPAVQFPFESPGNRFHVVTTPVTYSCNPGLTGGNGTGNLIRNQGYAPANPQPTPPVGGTTSLLASNVSACTFTYNAGGAAGRIALVAIQLQITQENETVTIYHEVHVDNVP